MRRERLVFRREAPRVGIPGDGKLFDESPIHQIECLFSLFGLEDSRGGSRRHRPTARVASVVHCSSPLNGRRVSTVAKVELPYMALQSPQMDTRSSGGLEAESAPDPGERQTRLSGAWTALIVGIAALLIYFSFFWFAVRHDSGGYHRSRIWRGSHPSTSHGREAR